MYTINLKKMTNQQMLKNSAGLFIVFFALNSCVLFELGEDVNKFEETPLPEITMSVTSPCMDCSAFAANGTTEVKMQLQILNQTIDSSKRTVKISVDNGRFVIGGELKKTAEIVLNGSQATDFVYRVPREGAGASITVSSAAGVVTNRKDFTFTVSCPDYMEIETAKTMVADSDVVAFKTTLFRNQGNGLVSTNLRPEYKLLDTGGSILTDANFNEIVSSDTNGVLKAKLVLEKRAKATYTIEVNLQKSGCTTPIPGNQKKIKVI